MDRLREKLLSLLHQRYPGIIPAFIHDRFNIEWEYLSWKACPDDKDPILFLYDAVVKAAREVGQPVWNCSFGSGSFLFYLLDDGLNPLEPHWQCGQCGKVEAAAGAALCFDLPARLCPDCGIIMSRDGIHGSAEEAVRSDGLEIRVNSGFLEGANQAALAALKDYSVFERRMNHEPVPADRRSYYFTNQVANRDRRFIHRSASGYAYINAEDRSDCASGFQSLTIQT